MVVCLAVFATYFGDQVLQIQGGSPNKVNRQVNTNQNNLNEMPLKSPNKSYGSLMQRSFKPEPSLPSFFPPLEQQYNKFQPHSIQQPQRNIRVDFLEEDYQRTMPLLYDQTRKRIQNWVFHREYENYLYFIDPEEFVEFARKERLQHFKEKNTNLVEYYMQEAIAKRQDKIVKQLRQGVIQIEQNPYELHKRQFSTNEDHSNYRQEANNTSTNMYRSQNSQSNKKVMKQFKEFLNRQKLEKRRIFELKIKESEKKQQLQAKKKEEEQEEKKQLKRQHSQIVSQKIKQNQQIRQKNKSLRQSRDQEFRYIIRSMSKGEKYLPLHEKMDRSFRRRYEQIFDEDRKRLQSQKQIKNRKIQELNLKGHEQKYRKWKEENDQKRQERLQEQQKILQLYESQMKSRYKKSRIEGNDSADEDEEDGYMSRYYSGDSQYIDPKETYLKKAAQKRKKMDSYWRTFVKDSRPKIDENKRQQIEKLIKQLENKRMKKKVKDEDGNWTEIEIKPTDSSMIGIEYLEKAKQMGRMRRKNHLENKKGESGNQLQDSSPGLKSEVEPPKDYLKILRQKRSESGIPQQIEGSNLKFLEKKDVPFEEKMIRVEKQAFKLQQSTKLSEVQLKFGKFKTSEEILQYKESIDNNHLQILKMKLKLASSNSANSSPMKQGKLG